MPGTETASDEKMGVGPLLQSAFIGLFKVSVSKLKLTTMGRPLRKAGVAKMLSSIKDDGWIAASNPAVMLYNESDEKGLDENNARDRTFRVLDGNHRIAALTLRDKNREGNEDTIITVSVIRPLSENLQRIIADRLNSKSELLVERTLADKVSWYLSFVRQEQARNPRVSVNAIAVHLQAYYQDHGIKAPGMTSLKSYIGASTNLKAGGLDALMDVTHLPNGEPGDTDLTSLAYTRVILSSFLRPPFRAASDTGQRAYIYRLAAKYKSGALAESDYVELDKDVKSIARAYDAVVAIAPVKEWTDTFKRFMRDQLAYEKVHVFQAHYQSIDQEVKKYRVRLVAKSPEAKIDEAHVTLLKGQPMRQALGAMTGSAVLHGLQTAYQAKLKASRGKANKALTAVEMPQNTKVWAIKVEPSKEKEMASSAGASGEGEGAGVDGVGDVAGETPAEGTQDDGNDDDSGAAGGGCDGEVSGAQEEGSDGNGASPEATESPGEEGGAGSTTKKATATGKRKWKTDVLVVLPAPADDSFNETRPMVTSVSAVSLLVRSPPPELNSSELPFGRPFSLIFLNLAANENLLTADEGSANDLFGVLSDINSILAKTGTLVIALPDCLSRVDCLTRALEKAEMTAETAPIISVYLGSKAGRPPKYARNDHRHHASMNVVAHKSSEYVCNSDYDDRKLRSSAPKVGARLPELDAVGIVVSANHPPKSTFLAPAVAEYCVARYTDANDAVLSTAGFRDDLASVVLGSGRIYAAFVADETNVDSVKERVRVGFEKACTGGFFDKAMSSAPVVIGPGLLPEAAPGTNLRAATHQNLAEFVEKSTGGDSTLEQHQFNVAQAAAAEFGLELKESAIHGHGVFAAKDFDDSCAGLPVEGSLDVYDTEEQLLNAVIEDGVPRYTMCGTDSLRKMCAGHESVRDGASLTLKPDRTCPWFYMNSSFVADGGTAKVDNVTAELLFVNKKLWSSDDFREILVDASNGVVVRVNAAVKKGTELILAYPYVSEGQEIWGGDEDV